MVSSTWLFVGVCQWLGPEGVVEYDFINMAVCRRVPEVGSRSWLCSVVVDSVNVCCCSFRASSVDGRAHFDRLGLPALGCRRWL